MEVPVAVRRIVTLGEPVLRQKAKKIHRVDNSIRKIIDDLIDTVQSAHGAGLAAPQIGVPLRVIVTNIEDELRVVINPEIVSESEEDEESEEGCLSIPGWWGPVKRKVAVTVRGMGRTGKPTKIKVEGLEARCFQHEIDHLDGVLFIDRMEDRSKLYKIDSRHEEEEMEEEHVIA
jgi:peptide deformylase